MAANTARDLLHDILGPIRPLLAREDVTDLCINGPGLLFVEGARGWERLPADNLTDTWLHAFARAVASYMSATVGERAPILSGHLPTGERVQIVLPPAAEAPSVTIRRPSQVTFTLDQLAAKGAFDPLADGEGSAVGHRARVRSRLAGWRADDRTGVPALLREIVAHRLNVIVSGATGSGKTTLSKALIAEIPLEERLIAIEDAKELVFPHANTARLFFSRDGAGVSPATVKDLLVSCLRMKPDRIMLAELRDDEAYYYLRNVNSGHPGLDHHDPRQQRRGGSRAAHAHGAPVERRGRADARGHPRPGREPGGRHCPDGPQAGHRDLFPARDPGFGARMGAGPVLKRPTPAIKWVIALSIPLGLIAFLPAASWAYAELGHFRFVPWVWLAGLQHHVDPRNLLLAGLVGGAAAIGLPGLVAWTLLPPKPLHGAARLARPGEIAKARLYRAGPHSILLGRHRGRLLAFNGDLHPFLAAATGTGKGVGFVVPNLLHWQGSVICLDIKGENYTLTSGYRGRALGQRVFRFDPLQEDGRTHAFNVLSYVRDGRSAGHRRADRRRDPGPQREPRPLLGQRGPGSPGRADPAGARGRARPGLAGHHRAGPSPAALGGGERGVSQGAAGGPGRAGGRDLVPVPTLCLELLQRAGEAPRLDQVGTGDQAHPVGQPADRPGHGAQRLRSAPLPPRAAVALHRHRPGRPATPGAPRAAVDRVLPGEQHQGRGDARPTTRPCGSRS